MLIDGEQFDVEDEGGAAGDTGLGELAVAHFGGDVDLPSVADVHLLHGRRKALDEVAQPARQGHVATAAVESRPINGLTRVMGGDHAAGRGSRARRVSLGQHLIENTLRKRLHAVFLRFCHQPILIGLNVLLTLVLLHMVQLYIVVQKYRFFSI